MAGRARTTSHHEDYNISFWDDIRDENCSQKGGCRP
jgi:hypothetical protein